MEPDYAAWVDAWSAGSVYRPWWDDPIAGLVGKAAFTAHDLERVYGWKYRGFWPKNKVRAMRAFDQSHPGRIADLTGRAFADPDELGALLILTLLPGAGAAGASAVLTAHDPERYTVMDPRALRSLIALRLWDERQCTQASCLYWPDYLAVCRALAAKAGRTLRDTDHALYSADGEARLPG